MIPPRRRVRFAKRRPEAEAAVEKILGVSGLFRHSNELCTEDMFAVQHLPEYLNAAALKIFKERLTEPAQEIEIVRRTLIEVEKEGLL